MTKAGRIAVLVNLTLAIVFAFWGVGLYTERIDWTNTKTAERQGQYAIRVAQIETLKSALKAAEEKHTLARRHLEAEEKRRPELLSYYEKELEALRTGPGPAKQPLFVKGDLQFDAKGLPQMVAAEKGLSSLRVHNEEYEARQNAIRAVRTEIERLIAREKELTEELVGKDLGKDRGTVRGLRGDLADQNLAHQKSQNEQEYLRPVLYNRQVEAQILVKRRKSLEARLKELEALPVVRNP